MKVLIVHCTYQYSGGEETVVKEEMNLLQKAGVEVDLLEFSNHGNSILKILQLPFNLSSYQKVRKKLKSFCPDVVHIHNLHFAASPSVIYAVKRSGIPLVCTLHNYRLLCPSASLCYDDKVFLDSVQSIFPFKAIKRGVYKNSKLLTFWLAFSIKLHQWMGTWKLPDHFIVLNQHAKEIFMQSKIRFRAGQLITKPNFCSVHEFEQMKRSEDFLYVGRLTEEKGVMMLLQVFSSSPYKILFAGDGVLKDKVIAFSKKYPNISYAGTLPKNEVFKLLRRSTALVFPSLWFEGMPLTIIEAFACGTPVIASDLGAMKYMITPKYDGLHFEAGNKAELLRALKTWAEFTPDDKNNYSINARNTYEQSYTPKKNIEQLLTIYKSAQKNAESSLLAFSV